MSESNRSSFHRPDAAAAPPLHAVSCLLIKVHGDQASPDLRNTLVELEAYDQPMQDLLGRILTEHGLVVCGWSATWDPALRSLLLKHQSPFYATFWATQGELTQEAQAVLKARLAVPLTITDADSFFENLAGKVEAIASIVGRRPSGADVLVAEVKRYLDDPTARIRLHDLVVEQVQDVIEATGGSQLPLHRPGITPAEYDERLTVIENGMSTVLPLLANLGFFASKPEHDELAVTAIRRLTNRPTELSGTTWLVKTQRYPALLGLYSLGLGCLASRRLTPLVLALNEITAKDNGYDVGLAYFLAPNHALEHDALRAMPEFDRHHTPSSDRLHARLRPYLLPFLTTEDEYDRAFDNLEYLLGLDAFRWSNEWGPIGRFKWRRSYPERGPADEVLLLHQPQLLEAGTESRGVVGNRGVMLDVFSRRVLAGRLQCRAGC